MELFVKTLIDNFYVENKCSLYGDEEIELTRSWYEQQILQGYGSYSTTFSIPADSNNCEIFHYYNVIGGSIVSDNNKLNPNYWLSSRLIINGYELIGNIQIQGFSTKNDMSYSFNVVFYGEEKSLVSLLNKSDAPKLNDIPLSGISFEFKYENVINTWTGDTFFFVPLMAMTRPLSYKEYNVFGNINYDYSGSGKSGVTMKDLGVAYNFSGLLDKFFNYHNLTFQHSPEVSNFLYKLYLMPNTKIEFLSQLTYINTQAFYSYIYYEIGGKKYNIMKLYPSNQTSNGIMIGNEDVLSWNNIDNYLISANYYTTQTAGNYNFYFNTTKIGDIPPQYLPQNVVSLTYFFRIVNYDTGELLYQIDFNIGESIQINLNLSDDLKIQILAYYTVEYRYWDPYYFQWVNALQDGIFPDNVLSSTIKISKNENTTYDFVKSTINFPDIYLSDFFNNFCKSFNIFYIYKPRENKIYTYFKQELERTTYDLTNHLLIDKNYTFNNEEKYKLVDYMFAEPKDINNLAWKQENPLWYGENKTYYNYDVGMEKLEYKSPFTIFPRTTLNLTDGNNDIIEDTLIPLHSELNQSYNTINTDYLLFYKQPPITGLTRTYGLQSAETTYTEMNYASDYGPTGYFNYDLNYNTLKNIIKDNVIVNYKVSLEFLLPFDILYNIKIYDYLLVRGIWYEILSMTSNMRNGFTRMDLLTTKPIFNVPITTTTTTSGTTTTTTTTKRIREISVVAKSEQNLSEAAKFYYKVNGGSWTPLNEITLSTNYDPVGEIYVTEGSTVYLGVQKASTSQNVQFGAGNGGGYSGNCGIIEPYYFNVYSNSIQYLNVQYNPYSGPPYYLMTCV